MLTKDEVNEALATLIHGDWRKYIHGKYPLDYCSNWNHLGPLLEKMVEAGPVEFSVRGGLVFAIADAVWPNRSSCDESTGDTLTEACAREVLAWMEGTKRGT